MLRGAWIGLGVLALGVAVALFVVAAAPAERATSDGGVAMRAVPVAVAQAVRRDVPLYLDGLGTVTALRTVTVRTQVDAGLQYLGILPMF